MTQTIKFRAMRSVYPKEWVYGYYVVDHTKQHSIVDQKGTYHRIVIETVGMWTGRKDSKGKEIYTGDLFKYGDDYDGYLVAEMRFEVDFHDDPAFVVIDTQNGDHVDPDGLEIAGNRWDNPDLLTPSHD